MLGHCDATEDRAFLPGEVEELSCVATSDIQPGRQEWPGAHKEEPGAPSLGNEALG